MPIGGMRPKGGIICGGILGVIGVAGDPVLEWKAPFKVCVSHWCSSLKKIRSSMILTYSEIPRYPIADWRLSRCLLILSVSSNKFLSFRYCESRYARSQPYILARGIATAYAKESRNHPSIQRSHGDLPRWLFSIRRVYPTEILSIWNCNSTFDRRVLYAPSTEFSCRAPLDFRNRHPPRNQISWLRVQFHRAARTFMPPFTKKKRPMIGERNVAFLVDTYFHQVRWVAWVTTSSSSIGTSWHWVETVHLAIPAVDAACVRRWLGEEERI